MIKLYTYDNKRITICNDFELKFESFLIYLKEKDEKTYLLLISSSDFDINREDLFKKFSFFFEEWLQNYFELKESLSVDILENIFNSIKMTESRYDEFFSYYNFYKRLFESENKTLSFYDSQSKQPHEYFKKYKNEI